MAKRKVVWTKTADLQLSILEGKQKDLIHKNTPVIVHEVLYC